MPKTLDLFEHQVYFFEIVLEIFRKGNSSKVAAFIDLMQSLGDVEIARTGVSAISRGNRIDLTAK